MSLSSCIRLSGSPGIKKISPTDNTGPAPSTARNIFRFSPPSRFSGGNIVFDRFIGRVSADHQHMGAAQVISGDVDPVLVFLGDFIFQKQRQEQNRADRGISGVIHLAAVAGGVCRVFMGVLAPGSGDIRKRSFHNRFLSPGSSGQTKTASFQKPPYISWLTCEV